MMTLKDYSTLLFLSLACCAQAQFTCSGTVTDAETQKPVGSAEVFNQTTNYLVRTDSKGRFTFDNLAEGYYTLIVFVPEYNVLQYTVEVTNDTTLTVELVPYSRELSEIVITQRREEAFALSRLNPVEGTAIYAGKKTEAVLIDQITGNLSANNARQVYAQVVGLNIYENGDAGLQLNIGGRGLDPNRTSNFNTRQNGYDISADVLGYPESYYTPPAEALRRIEVVRGAASLQYGTQFGGLLNFKFKEPNRRKNIEWISRQSYGSFNLFTSFNSLSGTLGKLSYYTYFNYKQGDGFRPNATFDSKNHYAHLHYAFNEKTSLTFESTYLHYLAQQPGGLTDTQFDEEALQSNRERNWFLVDWRLLALKFKKKITHKTDFSLNLFTLDARRDALGFRGDPRNPQDNPVTTPDDPDNITRDLIKSRFKNVGAEARLLTRYRLGKKEAVFLIGSKYYQSQNSSRQGAGTNGTEADFTFADAQFPDYPNQSDFDFPNLNIALFGENIFFVSDKLSFTPGFRYEFIETRSEGEYLDISFDLAGNEIFREQQEDNRKFERSIALLGLGMSYRHTEGAELYANLSQNYRSVTFSDIRVVSPTFIIDPAISDERGFTADAGIRGKRRQHLSYDLSAFAISYNDRIGTVLAAEGPDKGDRVRKNIGDALIYGLESFVQWNITKLNKDSLRGISFSPFLNLALTRSEYLNSEDNNVQGRKVEFIPAVNLKTGLRFRYGNLSASAQLTYLSRQYTDAQNTPVPDPFDVREGTIGEIPAYHIADLSLAYRYKKWRLETGCNNLLNEHYFTRRAEGYPGPGIIPSPPRSYYLALELKL